MAAPQIHCRGCFEPHAFRCEALVEHAAWLGSALRCAACSRIALTMGRDRRCLCPGCDAFVRPRLDAPEGGVASWLHCGACGHVFATFYGELPARLFPSLETPA